MKEHNTKECPICKGTGVIQTDVTMKFKRSIAKELRKKGLTYEQIRIKLGYKNSSAITHLLKPKP